MKRITWISAVTAGMVFALMARSPKLLGTVAAAPTAAQVEIKIDNFSFVPATVTVAPGTVVHWVNRDDIPHNVVSDDKSFKSKVMDTNEDFSFTFDKAGSYSYFCSIHPKMTGKVIVQ